MASSMIRTLVPHTTLSNGRTSHRSKKNVQVFAAENGVINPTIRKEEAKVVDTVVASEQEKPMVAYCRCWRSGTFPACDGSHMKHNEATGDNVGPLLVKKGD